MQIIPACFYHPISALFLDDSDSFLAALELKLHEKVKMITCTNADEAIQILNSSQENNNSDIFESVNKSEVDTATGYLINLEINKIHKLIYNKFRFDFIAMLIIDYQMPIINGVDFCRHINNNPICKIMLTAEADKNIAIDSFNEGLIDKFLLKQDENIYDELISSIKELKQRYFSHLSQVIIESLGKNFRELLIDDNFQKIFSNVFEKSKAVEYYLIDSQGSFLFLDENGIPTWLIIRSHQEIYEQISLLEGLGGPKEMIDFLKNKEKFLFLFSEKDYKKSITDWPQFLLNSQNLNDKYCYSVALGRITDGIDWDAITTYA